MEFRIKLFDDLPYDVKNFLVFTIFSGLALFLFDRFDFFIFVLFAQFLFWFKIRLFQFAINGMFWALGIAIREYNTTMSEWEEDFK